MRATLTRLQAERREVSIDTVTAQHLYDIGAVSGVRVRFWEVDAFYDPTAVLLAAYYILKRRD